AFLTTSVPVPRIAMRRPVAIAFGVAIFVVSALAPFSALRLARSPNAGFVTVQRSFLAGKWVAAAMRLAPESGTPALGACRTTIPSHAAPRARGIDLRDRDFLLVTVDALRADRLRALGGNGLTPSIDALAESGAVFAHAYTPTPHTSYALASLLTGKFLRPV